MKKTLLSAGLCALFVVPAGSAGAESAMATGARAVSISVEDSTADMTTGTLWRGKFFQEPTFALTAGAGLNVFGGDADGTNITLQGGARKYLATNSFAPFIGGLVSYSTLESDIAAGGQNATAETTTIAFVGELGAEYFFAREFSVEGSLRAGFSSSDSDVDTGAGTTNFTATNFGTFGSQVSLNYYF